MIVHTQSHDGDYNPANNLEDPLPLMLSYILLDISYLTTYTSVDRCGKDSPANSVATPRSHSWLNPEGCKER